MISVKQNTTSEFSISVADSFTSVNDFSQVYISAKKQNTGQPRNIFCDVISFDCTRKILKLSAQIDDSIYGEYIISIRNDISHNIIYRGMIIVEAPDKVNGFNGIIIG